MNAISAFLLAVVLFDKDYDNFCESNDHADFDRVDYLNNVRRELGWEWQWTN